MACGSSGHDKGGKPPGTLEQVAALVAAKPADAASVTRATGVKLAQDPTFHNPYFARYRGTGQGVFRAVELRVPTHAGATGGPLLHVELAPTPCVSQTDVMHRFGKNPALSVPEPTAPPSAPLYYVYQHDWGKLSFGFSRTKPECLTSVVLNLEPHP